MMYMLDTNICIYVIKKQPISVIEKFRQLKPGDIAISTITIAEMMFGVEESQQKEKNKDALDLFLAPLEIVDFDYLSAQRYGQIRAFLNRRGIPIGAYDLMIAAHCLSLGLTLVTNNLDEFSRVPGLSTENWVS